MRNQELFDETAEHFGWEGDWYRWDPKAAQKSALKARNARAKELERAGYKVSKFSLGNQLLRRGGIGSGHPDIEIVVKCYVINIF